VPRSIFISRFEVGVRALSLLLMLLLSTAQVERLYKEMQARTHARLQACGMEAADDSSDDQKGGNKNAKKKKKKDLSEMQGKPITTVTRHEMSVAISRIAIALSVLQEEVSFVSFCFDSISIAATDIYPAAL
jgi:hypothetical protein